MKLDRIRASIVSIVVAVLIVIPGSIAFSILMRRSMNDPGRVITGSIMHECMSGMPGSGFLRYFIRRVMSRQLHLFSLITLQISFHKLLNGLHSRQGSRSGSGKRRSQNSRSCRNSNCKGRTCLLTLWDLNFKKRTMVRSLLNLLCYCTSGGYSRYDDRYS